MSADDGQGVEMAGASTGRWLESHRGWDIRAWRPHQQPDAEPTHFTAAPAGTFEWTRFDTLEQTRAFVAGQPEIQRARIEFEVSIPPGVKHTDAQLYEWLRFSFGATGSLAGDNPFMDKHPAVVAGSFSVD